MKAHFTFSCILAASTAFSASEPVITDQNTSVFQHYLQTRQTQNKRIRPVYLRNASRSKEPSFSDMTILNLRLPSAMEVHDIGERILYGDPDIVHLSHISTQQASDLYEMLEQTYTHFIHTPHNENGLFIASKFPLSDAELLMTEEEVSPREEMLQFVIHGANAYPAYVSENHLPIQLIKYADAEGTMTFPTFLSDLPCTLTIVKQQFSLFQSQTAPKTGLLSEGTFKILPVKRGGSDNDRGGGYVEGSIDFKTGPNGSEWSVSGRGGYGDDRGNYFEGSVSQNDKGETSVSAKAGHENQ